MRQLDFLSTSPNIYIFREKTNKTIFGGVLFLIYIIIMISISLMYIIDYLVNDKYIIETSSYLNMAYKESMNPFTYLDNYIKDASETNPLINISFNLFKVNESQPINLSERFLIHDAFSYEPLQRNTFYQKKASEIGLILLYKCDPENCTMDKSDFSTFDYYLEMTYNGFELDHSKEIPLKNDNNIFFKNFYFFSFNNTKIEFLNWEVIKYKEEKGIPRLFDKLMGRKNEYISGYISYGDFTYIDHPIFSSYFSDSKIIAELIMTKGQRDYTEYKRRKISILDVLANIGALFSTFFSCFSFVFKYYSGNYNNYEIIQKIVTPKKTLIKNDKKVKKVKITELNEFPIISIDKDDLLLNDEKDDNIKEVSDESFDDNKKEEKKGYKRIEFVQFLLNNLYCKKCNKFNEQEIIRICNEIISNYLSVESILYNQIMLQNLFKDYKWNNQELNGIENNNLINNLKGHL